MRRSSHSSKRFKITQAILTSMLIVTAIATIIILGGCSEASNSVSHQQPQNARVDVASQDWDTIVEQARGSHLTFYGWGGDEQRNRWLNEVFAPYLSQKYGITLDVIGMDINDILAKLTTEQQMQVADGTVDMIWINGENFWSAKEHKLLYGPFTATLPNMSGAINPQAYENTHDFCVPIDGYEAPYGKAQFVFVVNEDMGASSLANAQEFMEYCKQHPGQVTYPAPPDFTGSAFVRNIIYDTCGWEQFQSMPADRATVEAAIEPALHYLNELKPYLWNAGSTYPESGPTLNNMYANNEVALTMSYSPYLAALETDKGSFPPHSKTCIFSQGTIGNTNYIAIAQNAPHKAAALVAINEMISVPMQLSMYRELKTLPVIENNLLTDQEKQEFLQVNHGASALSQDELLAHRLPEMPAPLVPIIEEIWAERVAHAPAP